MGDMADMLAEYYELDEAYLDHGREDGVVCRQCGRTHLLWRELGPSGKTFFWLFEADGTMHVCDFWELR